MHLSSVHYIIFTMKNQHTGMFKSGTLTKDATTHPRKSLLLMNQNLNPCVVGG